MATHLEKFKALMDEMGVKYKETKAFSNTFLVLEQGKKVSCVYSTETTFEFHEDGSLREVTIIP